MRAIAVFLFLASAVAHAQPSTQWSRYVLFAQDDIRIRTATIGGGDVGVSNGLLYMRGTIAAPTSDFVADVVHQDSPTDCHQLFANSVVGTAASCPQTACASGAACSGGHLVKPLVADLQDACGFTPPASIGCSSDPADDRTVGHGETLVLDPTKPYRNIFVEGGGAGPAVLKLTGDYRFCNLKVGRNGSVLFGGPSNVTITGTVRVSNASQIGPDASLQAAAPAPGAIHWFVGGSRARFSRHGNVSLYVCAPQAKMTIGGDTTLSGRFAARSIRMRKSTMLFTPPVPGVCGDGIVSPGECESSADCHAGQACIACACTAPPTTTTTIGGSTSTTITSTTTTSSTTPTTTAHSTTTTPGSTSTTTTLHPCTVTDDCPAGVCENAVCVPQCQTDDDCVTGSAGGGFVCTNGRCSGPAEICGDCIDNDGDGLIDFEDPDCCAATAGQLYPMDLRHARLRPQKSGGRSLLRLSGALARRGLAAKIDPRAQVVGVQIRSADQGELLCATIPAGKFVKRKKSKTYVFTQKHSKLPMTMGRNLSRMRIATKRTRVVTFGLAGRRTMLTTPAEGPLQVVVGFTRPGTPASQNVCSQAVRLFRGAKKRQLVFP